MGRLLSNSAKVETSERVKDILRAMMIDDCVEILHLVSNNL